MAPQIECCFLCEIVFNISILQEKRLISHLLAVKTIPPSHLQFWRKSKFFCAPREKFCICLRATLSRKEQITGGFFSIRFTTADALDTAASVYHGVSYL
jgi:hypothetical protein